MAFLRACIAVVLLCAPALGDSNTFMAPKKASKTPAALIWVQGALTPAHAYTPLMEAIQAASAQSLWIGQPSFLGATPEPARLPANIDATLKLMYAAGMPAGTPLYFGAHSLGTVFLQLWCAKDPRCKGQILTGGFIARTNYYPAFKYSVPTLTMGGSLDGLARATRVLAESYYQQIALAGQGEDFPVAVIEGMNHYQWGSGPPPLLERERDIRAELSLQQAHTAAAAIAGDWLDRLSGVSGSGGKVKAAVAATATFVAPLIAAYKYEGSRHFNGPAQIGGPGAKQCVKGGCPDKSGWPVVAQALIAGKLDGWSFEASNEFVDCSSTPLTGEVFHLPTITNDSATKTVRTTTYSQCQWDTLDAGDSGFVYTSASEIGTKLSSRQCLLIEGVGATNTSFAVDDPDFCMMANEKAMEWALGRAGAQSKARYQKWGQPLTFGPDIGKAGGPLFLYAGIIYKDNGDAGVEVSSPMQKTEIDYWKKHFGPIPRPSSVPDPGCFHYCKLLSPARAMEWIYVDGLRRHMPLNATAA